MVKVIFVKNPFSPARDRVIKLSEAADRPLNFYTEEFTQQLPNQEAWIQIDGRKVDAVVEDISKLPVKHDSVIVVMPKVAKGGKSILGLIAVIALSVVAMGVGNLLAIGGGSFFAGGAAWGAASYIGAAAVMFLGNSLVSRFFAPKIDAGKYGDKEDPTYSWSGVSTMDGQGNGIAITYGKVKSGGQSIMKFTSNDGNDQYFNWLVAVGEGELAITDIKLNSNPVENYESVTLDIRNGTNDQDVIQNFNDTILTKSVAYEIANDEWRTDQLEGNSTEGIIIEVECQNGLYHANDNGSLGTAWVDIQAQYALVGSDNWTTFVQAGRYAKNNALGAVVVDSSRREDKYRVIISSAKDSDGYVIDNQIRVSVGPNIIIGAETKTITKGETGTIDIYGFRFDKAKLLAASKGLYTIEMADSENRITGAKAGNVRRQFRIDNLPAGRYKVRVTVTDRSAEIDSSRDAVRIWWTQLSSIIYDDFCYPGVALLGIKAKATDQLSGGQPQLEFIKERATIYAWNPTTQAYEGKAANNPAWAAYDFIHGAERLMDINNHEYVYEYKGVPKELMLYEQFKQWADNCDRLNLKINLEITTLKDFWTIVNQDIAPVGRGMVVQFGTKFGCIYDHATQPVQLFTMGNIVQGSFSLSYLSTDERADSIELTYVDAEKEYEKTTLTIYSDDYDSLDIPNQPTQIAMHGITSYEQAYREGKYQLYCNRLLTKTISFKADVEAIGCMVGDVIQVAHDVPQWSISGRVLEALDDGSVILPIDPDELQLSPARDNLLYPVVTEATYIAGQTSSVIGYQTLKPGVAERFGKCTVRVTCEVEYINAAFTRSTGFRRAGLEMYYATTSGKYNYVGAWDVITTTSLITKTIQLDSLVEIPEDVSEISSIEAVGVYVQGCTTGKVIIRNAKMEFVESGANASDYALMIRSSADNTLTTYSLMSLSGTYGEVKAVAVGNKIHAEDGDLFSIGKVDAVVKPFTVTGITRSKDLEYTITAIEYADGIFDENYTIPPKDTTLITDPNAVDVINLDAHQVGWKDKLGRQMSHLYISWAMPEGAQADSFTVLLSKDTGRTWSMLTTTTNMSAEADVTAYTVYYVKVITNYRLKQSSGAVCGPVSEGTDELPPNVTKLDVEVLHNGTRRYYWDFAYPNPNDIAGFRFKYIQGSVANWNTGFLVQDGLITAQPYETATVRQGVHTIMIKAVDNAGQESANFATCLVDFGEPLEDNVLYKLDFSANHWSNIQTSGSVMLDGYIHSKQNNTHYIAPSNYYWDSPTADFWGSLMYQDFYIEATLTAPASGNFYVLYDIVNAANILYKVIDRDNIYKQYSTKFKVNAGERISLRFEAPSGSEETVLKKLIAVIDVPDREEHFEKLVIPAEGLELPIVTPNYQTTAVKIDSISSTLQGTYQLDIVSRMPCKIRFYRINNDAGWSRDPVAVTANITWQGFEKEVI